MNNYRVMFDFTAPSDSHARKRIQEGVENLGTMRIINLGERQTLRIAAWSVILTLGWVAIVWCVWPHMVAFWSRLP